MGPIWECCLGVVVVVQYTGMQVYNNYPFKSGLIASRAGSVTVLAQYVSRNQSRKSDIVRSLSLLGRLQNLLAAASIIIQQQAAALSYISYRTGGCEVSKI